jgi:hypothetical protein
LFGTALLYKIKFSLKNVMSNTPKISNPTQKKDKVDINFIIFIFMKQQNRYFINYFYEAAKQVFHK